MWRYSIKCTEEASNVFDGNVLLDIFEELVCIDYPLLEKFYQIHQKNWKFVVIHLSNPCALIIM